MEWAHHSVFKIETSIPQRGGQNSGGYVAVNF